MSNQHYFSAPEGPLIRRSIDVQLAGQTRRLSTAGGVFSPDGLDKGTTVLLDYVSGPAATGDLLDIGCGWGPIALTMALRSPAAHVWAVEVNPRARKLCAENAEQLGLENITVCSPEEVPSEVQFATIWSNPPIRIGKPALHELLIQWLPRLGESGEALLVVQKNLGSDSLQRWLVTMLAEQSGQYQVQRVHSQKGFRVLQVTSVGHADG